MQEINISREERERERERERKIYVRIKMKTENYAIFNLGNSKTFVATYFIFS